MIHSLTLFELEENVKRIGGTRYWRYIGQLFNHLRVQKDTAFIKLLENRNLLGLFHPNTMDYAYSFQNPLVKDIASICINSKDEIDEVYSLARNVQRTYF